MAVFLTSPKEGDLSGGQGSEPDTAAQETWLWEGSSYDLEWELPLLKVSKREPPQETNGWLTL